MELRAGRLAELLRENLDADTAFACHETLGADEALCRGFVDRFGERVTPVRLARALDLLVEVPTPVGWAP